MSPWLQNKTKQHLKYLIWMHTKEGTRTKKRLSVKLVLRETTKEAGCSVDDLVCLSLLSAGRDVRLEVANNGVHRPLGP
jgi:hypothetical protein